MAAGRRLGAMKHLLFAKRGAKRGRQHLPEILHLGNITEVHFLAGDATDREQSEIWVPDIQLFNSNVGTQASLDRAKPVAYSDGSVFWSRPGLLDALCKPLGASKRASLPCSPSYFLTFLMRFGFLASWSAREIGS